MFRDANLLLLYRARKKTLPASVICQSELADHVNVLLFVCLVFHPFVVSRSRSCQWDSWVVPGCSLPLLDFGRNLLRLVKDVRCLCSVMIKCLRAVRPFQDAGRHRLVHFLTSMMMSVWARSQRGQRAPFFFCPPPVAEQTKPQGHIWSFHWPSLL